MFKLATRSAAIAALTAPVALLGMAGPASATPGMTYSTGSPTPAVVGPLLDFFAFGTNIGAPLVCGVLSAGVGDGAAQYGFAKEAAVLVNSINTGCTTFSSFGSKLVSAGQATDSPLAAVNAIANGALSSTGSSLTQAAGTLGPAINPFGPTVAGLGGTVAWFEGS